MFIGRQKEIAKIQDMLKSSEPKVCAVFGRRRVGKSKLILESLKDTPYIYLEGIENKSKKSQLLLFIQQINNKLQLYNDFKATTWAKAFLYLAEKISTLPQRPVIVLDEIQWLANYRSDLVSELKMAWETELSNHARGLILCGSQTSFIQSKIIRGNAFYGRIDLIIKLQAFSPNEIQQMLAEKNIDEVLLSSLIFGGIPKYLEVIKDEPSVVLAINKHCFNPYGFFMEEDKRIFVSQFGKKESYQKIVQVLSKHPYGLTGTEIAEYTKISSGGTLSKQVKELYDSDIISCNTLNKRKYFLSDPFLNFYYKFIREFKDKTNRENKLFIQLYQTPKFHSFLGSALEIYVKNNYYILAELLGFSDIEYTYGSYFQSKGAQIDLMFIRKDKVITLCEIKYGEQKDKAKLVTEVNKKAEVIREIYPKYTIQRVLVYNGKVADSILNSGEFYKAINVADL